MNAQVRRKIDHVDREIMAALSQDPQTSNKNIARSLGVSEMTVASRIESLTADRLMRTTIQRDIRTLGYEVVGWVEVFVKDEEVLDVARTLAEIPEAISATIMTDSPQLSVLLMARTLQHFVELTEQTIAKAPGVAGIRTTMCLDILHIRSGIGVL